MVIKNIIIYEMEIKVIRKGIGIVFWVFHNCMVEESKSV